MPAAPSIARQDLADGVRLALAGDWTLDAGAGLEREAAELLRAAAAAHRAVLDISAIRALDTAGAWVIDRSRQAIAATGVQATLVGVSAEHATLLREAHYREAEAPERPHVTPTIALLADIGQSVVTAGSDLLAGLDFLGRVMEVGLRAALNPRRWRITSLVFHIESFALRGAPIILMINFFVGAIVAQQGIFQLARFGASSLHRRSRGHSHLARAGGSADVDHGRRPLGVGDHGRNRRDEDARGN